MNEETKTPTIWVSIGTTVNVGNYENYKVDVGLAGIPIDISDEDLAKRVQESQSSFYRVTMALADELAKRVIDVKGKLLGQ